MRAIVHIGTEKTGTSSIQQFLFQNRKKLRGAGYHFVQSAGKTNNRALPAICISEDRIDDFFRHEGVLTSDDRVAYREKFLAEFEKELSSLSRSVHTVVISSEHFHSRIRTEEEMDNVHRLLTSYFDEFHIICYLREQVRTCASYYSTSLKTGFDSSFNDFMQRCAPHNYYFNYSVMLDNWERCFGREALDVALFDHDRFLNNDLLDDFTARIDRALVGKLNKKIQVENESLSTAGQALALGVNQAFPIRTAPPEFAPIREKSERLIYQRLKGRGRQPSLQMQREMYEAFEESNEKLRQKFFPQEEKLFDMPEADPASGFELDDNFMETLISVLNIIKTEGRGLLNRHQYSVACGQVISTVIEMATEDPSGKKVARTLTLTEDDARVMRRAAMRLEGGSVELAEPLMKMAYTIAPSLPGVKAKLEHYRDYQEDNPGRNQYLIAYYLYGDRLSDEEKLELRERWMDWLTTMDTVEGSYLKMLSDTRRFTPGGGVEVVNGDSPTGITVIRADSLEQAVALVKECPCIKYGATMEVSSIEPLNPPAGPRDGPQT